MNFNTISVIGLGYIGLPTAALLASRSKRVVGVDINQSVVDSINAGDTHIVEPHLDGVVRDAVSKGYLKATTKAEPADAFLICVPTPFKNNFQPDLFYIEAAAKAIAPVLKAGNLVILESTSPVGTTEQLACWLKEIRDDLIFPEWGRDKFDIQIAHCPERVLPGNVLKELCENDRIIGGISESCAKAAIDLYKIFVKGNCIVTKVRTAEMCKLVENSFRDVNIAFANELSVICEKIDIDIWELITLANRHPRVDILKPGPGVGGHCIAVDPWFIVHQAPNDAKLIRTAREVNDTKPHWVLMQVQQALNELLIASIKKQKDDITIACFGLAFKADIDDLRGSPALKIAEMLHTTYPSQVVCVEPNLKDPSQHPATQKLKLVDAHIGLTADIILMLVDHQDFATLKPNLRSDQRLIDTRGLWNSELLEKC